MNGLVAGRWIEPLGTNARASVRTFAYRPTHSHRIRPPGVVAMGVLQSSMQIVNPLLEGLAVGAPVYMADDGSLFVKPATRHGTLLGIAISATEVLIGGATFDAPPELKPAS